MILEATLRDEIAAPELLYGDDDHQHRKAPQESKIKASEFIGKSSPRPTVLGEFPLELIVLILSRLPLKSVLRFKVVCKNWYKILRDPYFSHIRSKNSPFKTLLLCSWTRKYQWDFCLFEIFEDGDCIRTPFTRRFMIINGWYTFYPFCDGTICIDSRDVDKCFHIWNPIMNGSDSVVTLPHPKVDIKKEAINSHYSHQYFGHISSLKKVKILKLWFLKKGDSDGFKPKVAIFTIGVDDGLRCLPDDVFELNPIGNPKYLCGVVLNGIFHWTSPENACMIGAIDLVEEKRGNAMTWPGSGTGPKPVFSGTILVLNDRLSILEKYDDPLMITIWTMKEYDVMESWTRIDILQGCITSNNPSLAPLLVNQDIHGLSPAVMLENGVIVLVSCQTWDKLVFYDPKLRLVIKVEDLTTLYIRDSIRPYAPCILPLHELMNTKGIECPEKKLLIGNLLI